ncbi:MAG: rane protein of unknown function, partial [Herminiimonas sp.]|nr:rane protein of unknown function [Herminiimonas sp.]
MVAIVSGEGLGISLSSLSLLGQHGVRGNAAGIRNGESAYINIANGNLVLQGRDEHLESYGLSVDFLRTYNSRGQYSDGGDNWNLGVNRKRLQIAGTLGAPGSTISRTDQDGAQAIYGYDPGRATYVNRDGPAGNNTIRYESETETLLWTDGIAGNHERYEATGQGRLVSTIDNAGNTITYTYGSNGLLSSIVDASGETTELRYDGSKLTQVRTLTASGGAVTRVRYAHDAQDRLASVIIDLSPTDNSIEDGKVYRTSYRYDGDSNRIASITQSDGSTQWFTYIQAGGSYKIASVTDGAGKTTRFDYDTMNLRTTVTDPLNLVSTYRYDESGRLIQMTAPPVDGKAQTNTFTYGYGGHVTRIDTGAQTVTMQYASNGNLVRKMDSSGNTVSRTYVGPNRLQTETVYATASSGDALPSAPLTTRYVYDGFHFLRFVISPEGRVAEYRYDARGDRTAEIRYGADTYVGGLSAGDVPTLGEMQAWAEAANSAFTTRSDLAYDFRGQLSSVTAYASVDDAGNGIADGTQSRTNYVYDQAGLLLSTVDSQSHVTHYVHDGLGRVLAVTDASNNVTVTQYDDADNRTVVRLANGLTTTSAYDGAGRLIGVAQSDAAAQGLGATTYAYDANGRLRMTQDPTGVRRHMLYDAAGRKVADIDASGALTEYFYNAGNSVIRTIAYQNRLSASALASLVDAGGTPDDVALASIRPEAVVTGAAVDRSQWNIYDAAERLVMTVDAAGNVTQNLYDGASRPISVIRYATRVDTSSLGSNPTMSEAIPPASPQDRITRHFHDSDGLLRGTLDAEGYLVEYRYDAAGRRTGSIAYATPVGEALRTTGALSAMIPAAGDKDIHVHTLYNGKGQVSGRIDGEGYLTETVYDTVGNLAGTIRYAARVALPPSGIAGATVAALRPASGAEDRVVSNTYTALGQLLSQTNAEGTETRYGYDSAGNLLSTTVAAGTADLRSITRQYDLQGRLTAELSAQGVSQLNGDQTREQIDEIWTRYGMHYAYDAAGRRTAATDPNGNRTLFFYDRDGRLTHTVNALGEVQEQHTNSLGQLISTRQFGSRLDAADMAGITGGLMNDPVAAVFDALRSAAADTVHTFTYTADGLSATTTDALNNTSILSYNAFGEVTASTAPIAPGRAAVRNIAYDRRGLQVAVASAGAGVDVRESTRYDAFGRAIESIDGNGNLRTTNYDRLGRTVQTIDPANALRSTAYDAFDRVLSTTDALNNVTRYAYDTAARSVSVTSPEGITITTAHNRHGQKASVRDGHGEVTRFSYDRNGNLLETATSLTTVSSRYDGANRLTQTTDANGNTVAFSYDAANRLLTRLVDPGGLHLATTYTFDAKGRQIGITDPNGVVTGIHYDLKGQVISRTV